MEKYELKALIKEVLQEVQTEELKEEFLIARKDVIKTLKFKKYCSIATLTVATVLKLRLLLIRN